jgi:DNA invertase Pin-like site-specific DNA recombinase
MSEERKCHLCGTEYPEGSEHGECDWCPGVSIRRSKSAMEDLRQKMRALEAEGKSRKEIALALGCTQAQVTRGLGALRCWRDRRIA